MSFFARAREGVASITDFILPQTGEAGAQVQAPYYSNGTHTETLEIGNNEYSNDSANGTTSNGHSTTIEYSNDSKGHAAFSVATFPNVVSKHQNPLKLTWGALRERFTTHAFRTNKDGELFAPVTFKPGTRRKKENVGAIHLFSTRLRQRLCTRRLLQRLA